MILRFHGHACFGIVASDGTRLCVDPYRSGDFGGAVALKPVPDRYDAWIATHEHPDHNAGDTLPRARRLHAPAIAGTLRVEGRRAFHDEFSGLLRSGTTDLLRIADGGAGTRRTIVHCGDLGERPSGALLEWLRAEPIDVLIVPVGGYYTLGPDGATELVEAVGPKVAVPCHAREHGVNLPALGTAELFLRRFGDVRPVDTLDLSALPTAGRGPMIAQMVADRLG